MQTSSYTSMCRPIDMQGHRSLCRFLSQVFFPSMCRPIDMQGRGILSQLVQTHMQEKRAGKTKCPKTCVCVPQSAVAWGFGVIGSKSAPAVPGPSPKLAPGRMSTGPKSAPAVPSPWCREHPFCPEAVHGGRPTDNKPCSCPLPQVGQ